jgi:hypothetical protein
MTNEMKLLTALCDALGFDVERVCVNQEEVDAMLTALQVSQLTFNGRGSPPFAPAYVHAIYEYKLTKRVIDAEIEWGKSVGILDGNGDHKQ